MISLPSYLFIAGVLFVAGIVVIFSRKGVIAIFLGIELLLNSAALSFVAYSRFLTNNLHGHVFSLFIIVIAAAEAAVGLGIVIRFFKLKNTIHVDEANFLKN